MGVVQCSIDLLQLQHKVFAWQACSWILQINYVLRFFGTEEVVFARSFLHALQQCTKPKTRSAALKVQGALPWLHSLSFFKTVTWLHRNMSCEA